jgi:DNA-binding MarR family transcriptional regulator
MRLLLDAQVARDMMQVSGLSEADYDVLTNLSESEGHRRRLSKLAAHMLWSTSRLSHHISRMEQRGLVRRRGDPSDARGAFVVLTKKGLRAVEEAAPSHVGSVRRHFIDLLSPEQLDVLGDVTEKVLDRLVDNGAQGVEPTLEVGEA